jgi:hypothetical protein
MHPNSHAKEIDTALDEFSDCIHCMHMAKTKKTPVRHLQVRLSPRLYMAVDRLRGPKTRQVWVVGLIEEAVRA